MLVDGVTQDRAILLSVRPEVRYQVSPDRRDLPTARNPGLRGKAVFLVLQGPSTWWT